MRSPLEDLRDEIALAAANNRMLRAQLAAVEQERDSLVAFARVHAQQCYGCKSRLATRSYVDPDGGARVWICDGAECAELWRCDRCGATDFTASYCPQCGHTGIALATLEFTDAPHAAGLRFANRTAPAAAPEAP